MVLFQDQGHITTLDHHLLQQQVLQQQTLSVYLILKLFLPRSARKIRRNECPLQGTPESLELLELAKGVSEERRAITLVIPDCSWTPMQILRPLEKIVR